MDVVAIGCFLYNIDNNLGITAIRKALELKLPIVNRLQQKLDDLN